MARLERIGDRSELVTSDGVRLPWMLDEDPLADLGVEIGPSATGVLAEGSGAVAGDGAGAPSVIPSLAGSFRYTNTPLGGEQIPGLSGALEKQTGPVPPTAPLSAGFDNSAGLSALKGGAPTVTTAKEFRDKEESDKAQTAKDKQVRGGGERREAPDGGRSLGGGAVVRRIPGGPRLEGYTRTVGASKENLGSAQEAVDRSARSGRAAVTAEADFQADQARAEAAQLDDYITQQGFKVAEGRGKVEHARRTIADAEAEMATERADLAKMANDPPTLKKMWADAGTGTKLLTIFGMLLAGIGGSKDPLAQIKEAVANDQAVHREKLAAKERGASFRKDELDRLREKLDPDLAEKEIEGRKLAIAGAQLRSYGLKTGNPALIAKANAAADQIDKESALLMANVDREYGDRVTETVRNVPDQYIQTGGQRALKPEERGREVIMPDGTRLYGRTEAQAKEAQGAIAPNAAIAEAADRIRAIREEPESRMPLSEKRAAIATASADMFLAIKAGANLGTLDKGALAFREEYIGNPEALISPGAGARLDELSRGARKRVDDTRRFYLYQDPDNTVPAGVSPSSGRKYED